MRRAPTTAFQARVINWRGKLRRLDAWMSSPPFRIAAFFLILCLLPFAIPNLPPLSIRDWEPSCSSTPSFPPPESAHVAPESSASAVPFCVGMLCFEPVNIPRAFPRIFGFAEFIAALALLVVLYTVVDVRYKFRLMVAPAPLEAVTFRVLVFIGLATLLTEVWWAEAWWLPRACWLTRNTWQMILGVLFFGTFATWIYYAFVGPPTYGKRNAVRFGKSLSQVFMRGEPQELAVIASELMRSADSIVEHASRVPPQPLWGDVPREAAVAHEILFLLGDRKFCRQVVASSPGTAAAFFSALARHPGRQSPLYAFAMNVSAEAIAQKDSFLYHEDRGIWGGLLGRVKPITYAIYGNYEVLSMFGNFSPLDINYEDREDWDSTQWAAYCRVVLLAFKGYIDPDTGAAPTVISRAFGDMERSLLRCRARRTMPVRTPNHSATDVFSQRSGSFAIA
ncbi:MAG TPA: hypothetical protein VKR38_05585, partial [Usitatibacter sp.]|nr:hypothetical protein [Usitatibacter sp.]